MSFSFLGGLASLLPGYIQGQRMANQDNWQDLMNYNKVQQGQQSNAFTEATWTPRVGMMWDQLMNSNMGVFNNTLTSAVNYAGFPEQLYNAQARSMYAPWTSQMVPLSQLQMWNNYSQMRQNPWAQGAQQVPTAIG